MSNFAQRNDDLECLGKIDDSYIESIYKTDSKGHAMLTHAVLGNKLYAVTKNVLSKYAFPIIASFVPVSI